MKKSEAKKAKRVEAAVQAIVAADPKVRRAPRVAQKAAEPAGHIYPEPIIVTDDNGAPYFACGPVRFPIDGRDLARTLGSGAANEKAGLIDQVNDHTWQGVLAHLGLPIKPWSRDIARPVMLRIVQRAWYAHYDPDVLARNEAKDKDNWAERDNITRQQYITKVQAYATQGEARIKKIRSTPGGSGTFARKDLTYVPEAPLVALLKKKDWGLKGQQALVLGYFKENPAGGTVAQVTAALVAGGFKCNQDPQRAIYYYLNEWKKKGWLAA